MLTPTDRLDGIDHKDFVADLYCQRTKRPAIRPDALLGLMLLANCFTLVSSEQLADTVGEERRNSKVQELFFRLMLQNQNVAWLNQWS